MSFILDGVTYSYRRHDPPVLQNLSLTLPGGMTTAILGPSGAGKSTLLNLLGLLWEGQLTAGTITYTRRMWHDAPRREVCAAACRTTFGSRPLEYGKLSDAERARLRRDEFGFIPQNSYLLPGFTCEQNILMPLALQGLSSREARRRLGVFLERQEFRDLRGILSRYGGEIAGGQRQRVAVLRAVIHNPSVIFADEPVSNLDPRNKEEFLDLLYRWQHGRLTEGSTGPRTLLLVCHDAETAWRMADRFLFLALPSGKEDTHFHLLERQEIVWGAEQVQRLINGAPPG